MADHDPFPRDRVGATIRRMPAYLKLSWRLGRDPLLSRARRMAVVGAAGYLASPVDLVPGVIPVIGQLDDIAFALGALKFALAGLDAERRHEHLAAVGLEDGDLTEDLRTVGATSAWMVRAGARTTVRAARGGARAAAMSASAASHAAAKAMPVARGASSMAAPAVRTAAGTAGRAASAAASATRQAAPAARSAASKGFAKVRILTFRSAKDPVIKVSDAPRPALAPGTRPPDDPAG
jgi:uncharacterized membrane protein YkvA (DUF1232 family)